jgi:hypothetical protein
MPSAEAIRIAKRTVADMGIGTTNPPHDDTPFPKGPGDYGLSPDAEPDLVPRGTLVGGSDQKAIVTGVTEKPKERPAPVSWWRDPATIPPRQSLYDGHYIRRAIGATIGAGGRAKTTRGLYEATSMTVGFDIATKDVLPEGRLRVWSATVRKIRTSSIGASRQLASIMASPRRTSAAGYLCSPCVITRCGSPR